MSDHLEPVRWHSRQRHLQGWPNLSETAMNVLIRLHNAAQDGAPFDPLADVHKHTLRFLQREDLIFASKGFDGLRFKLTGRGERTMKAYLRPPKRHDDICPTCGVNPKHVTAGGRKEGYCKACGLAYKRGQVARHRRIKPGRLCSTCGKRPVHRYAGGSYSTYCTECNRDHKRAQKRRKQARLRARIDAGDVPTCQRPGCTNPIYYSHKWAYEVCTAHWREYMLRYNDRRRPHSQAARARRYSR